MKDAFYYGWLWRFSLEPRKVSRKEEEAWACFLAQFWSPWSWMPEQVTSPRIRKEEPEWTLFPTESWLGKEPK